jgi:hypothetical protein
MIQKSIILFQDNQDGIDASNHRISEFFFLDFIKSNYGLDVFEIEKGELLEEKMNLMLSSFQLIEELDNIYCYVKRMKESMQENQENKIQKFGEEILMIYKFFHVLLSTNHHLFSNIEMKFYSQIFQLQKAKEFTEKIITEVMIESNYFLVK